MLGARGDHAILYGTLSQALRRYEDAQGIASRLAKLSPPYPLADHDLLISYYDLGKVSLQAAKLPEATKYYQEYLAIAQRFAADPANADGQRDLSIAYELLGDVSLRADKLLDAVAYYQQDLAIATRAAEIQPQSARPSAT